MNSELSWSQGGDTTFLRCTTAPGGFREWYAALARLVTELVATPGVEIVDNGFRSHPDVFTSDGVSGEYHGKAFSLWSDLPGELILKHGDLRAGQVESLCILVGQLWGGLAE